jgi:16S rRNA (cytosine967-C5)-methyltransferase
MKTARRQPAAASQNDPPGLATRRIAADIVEGVLRRQRPLDELFDGAAAPRALTELDERDRAFVRALAATVIRRLGSLRYILSLFLEHGPPKEAPRAETALLVGAAQILFLNVPDHAAVDLSVRLAQRDRHAAHYTGLVNAVLRRVVREGAERLRGGARRDGEERPGRLGWSA